MKKSVYKVWRRGGGMGGVTGHTGFGTDRRPDKRDFQGPSWLRRYQKRYGQ